MIGGVNTPLEVILTWPRPNLVNPDLRPATILILTCTLGPITIGLSLARLWLRIRHQRNPGWDDWLMALATILMIALTVLFPLACQNKFDRHIWDKDIFGDPQSIVTSRKYVLAIQTLFCAVSGLIKISILLFYRRLGARVVSQTFRWVTWASIGSIAAYSFILIFALLLGCRPLSAYWERDDIRKLFSGDYTYHCVDEGALMVAASIISTVQDLITAILPTFLYWNIQIPLRKKIALFSIFTIGYGAGAIGALRAYYSWYVFYGTYDITWAIWDLLLVAMLEMHVGAFCANAPAMRAYYNYIFHGKSKSQFGAPKNSKDQKGSWYTRSDLSTTQNLLQHMRELFTHSTSPRSKEGSLSKSHDTVIGCQSCGGGADKNVQNTHCPPASLSALPANHHTVDVLHDRYFEDIETGSSEFNGNSSVSSTRSLRCVDEEIPETLPPVLLPPKKPMFSTLMKSLSSTITIRKLPGLTTTTQSIAEVKDRPLDINLSSLRASNAARSA